MSKYEMKKLVAFLIFTGFLRVSKCTSVEGKTLKPVYWNTSNPLFGVRSNGGYQIDAAINDKLDIICPNKQASMGRKAKLFYFKLYLVSKDNFDKCNVTGGRRLLNCDVPEKEKKYTFYFQEISPSPWGLEFTPEKSYYVISTSTGSKSGINNKGGGACSSYNMKMKLKIHESEELDSDPVDEQYIIDFVDERPNILDKPKNKTKNSNQNKNPSKNEISDPTLKEDKPDNRDGLIIGAVLGAFAVLFILLLVYFVYKIYGRHRYNKKYHSPSITPTRSPVDHLDQHVTLLPIHPDPRLQHNGRSLPGRDRLCSATLSTHNEIRFPPSYNETFLENGGTVACV